MTKFISIEDEKQYWKAKFDKLSNTDQLYRSGFASGLLRGIDLAHEYNNKPSNTAIQIDKKPCMHCKNEQEVYKAHDFCGFCGRAFDD